MSMSGSRTTLWTRATDFYKKRVTFVYEASDVGTAPTLDHNRDRRKLTPPLFRAVSKVSSWIYFN